MRTIPRWLVAVWVLLVILALGSCSFTTVVVRVEHPRITPDTVVVTPSTPIRHPWWHRFFPHLSDR
jgi:hypothetical protein